MPSRPSPSDGRLPHPLLDPEAGDGRLARQRRVLRAVLVINAAMFVVEIVSGWYAGSTALLADALANLALLPAAGGVLATATVWPDPIAGGLIVSLELAAHAAPRG